MARQETIQVLQAIDDSQPEPPLGYVRLTAEIPVFEEKVTVAVNVPDRRICLGDVAPLAHSLCDRFMSVAVERAAGRGHSVMCGKGCSNCCRSFLVLLSTPDAFNLCRRIRALPEARQRRLEKRFAAEAGKIARSGGLPVPDGPSQGGPADEQKMQQAIYAWMRRAGMTCPLLEADVCGLYPHRPVACRELLVSSDPQFCGSTSANRMSRIKPAFSLDQSLDLPGVQLGATGRAEPVIMAVVLAWGRQKSKEIERTWRGPDMVRRFLDIVHDMAEGSRRRPANQADGAE